MQTQFSARFRNAAVLAGIVAAAAPLPAVAQELTGLGHLTGDLQSAAFGVSADGTVAIGTSYGGANNNHAFRWTSGGLTDLGALSGHNWAEAHGISSDGSVVVGYSAQGSAPGSTSRAFRWQGGSMTDLGTLGGSTSAAYGVSGDGNVAVGQAGTGSASHAFRWTAGGGMQDLGTLAGTPTANSWAYAASQDGGVVVGKSDASGGGQHAFRWTGGAMTGLGTLGGAASTATGVSADGAIVVGDSFTAGGMQHVFRWTQANGMTDLGTLGGANSYGAAISTDGNVIVGTSYVAGNGSTRGFRWTQAGGMQSVNDWLTANGVTVSPYLVAGTAHATNQDGSVVVGKLNTGDAYIARVSGSGSGSGTGGSGGAGSGSGSGSSGSSGGSAGSGSGLITIRDIAQSLLNAAAAHGVMLDGLGVLLNGAGSRPLDRRTAAGKRIVWLGGDWGRDDHGARDGEMKLGEVGVGGNFGGFQLNGVIGVTRLDQDTLLGGSTRVMSNYVKLEALAPIHAAVSGGLWLAVTGTGAWGDAAIRRHYLTNGGTVDASTGRPDIEGYGLRGRLQWENLAPHISPYGELSYARSCLESYSETGGAFPSAYGTLCDDATEARYGFDALIPLADSVRFTATLEGVHRVEDKGRNISGQVIGLGAFDLAGASYRQDWLRAGVGFETDLGGGILSLMGNGTTRGESASAWVAANWRLTF